MTLGRKKISLVGAGQIGGTLAHLTALKQIGDIQLLDVNEGMAKGKALDLQQSFAISGIDCTIQGGSDFANLKDSDAVIVTAGVPRKPGMSRDDLLKINADIITATAHHIKKHCPQAFVIVITNPLDVMVWLMQRESGINASHVVGMAGILDTARYKSFLAKALNVSVSTIQAFVLGGHGDTMVPMPHYTRVAGMSLKQLVERGYISKEALDAIDERTRHGGAEIVNLLQNGSAFYAPATAGVQMLASYFYDEKKILPCAAYIKDAYNVQDLYVGVPCVIGKGGVEKIVEVDLNDQEQQAFEHSASAVRTLISDLEKLGY